MPGEGYFGRHQGLVWRSTDGRSWTATIEAAFQFVTPEHVVAQGDALFVFGTSATCDGLIDEECIEPPEAGWAVWRSTAGGPWERLPQLEQMQHGVIDGVLSTGSGLVAFGWTGEDAAPIVWKSVDGAAWTRMSDLAGWDQVTAMGVAPAGELLAFGTRYSQELDDLELLAATSGDGVNFTPAAVPQLAGTTIHGLTAGNGGLVAVGDTDNPDLGVTAVTLRSVDGATWTQTSAMDDSFAGGSAGFVHATTTGYLALGAVPSTDDFGIASGTSWFSADGLGWRSLGPLGGQFTDLVASTVGASGIVAFTVTQEETDDENVISTVSGWLAPMEALSGLR